ncbi:XRE family transcriptional regulator [Streptomyces palmae]|uniref:XRE family transcriptional regulator n=2 Tax=Streptomyces palmae TaxID=1701085 RepID=A0A4Z0HF26_9ACTN|nr:XRE family transcriptional regulator [Streptomyces palmae]
MGSSSTEHRPSCAKRIRLDGEARSWSISQIAEAIRDHCSVSKLRAYRMAKGLTQQTVAEALRHLAAHQGNGARPDGIQLGRWETRDVTPKPETVRLLCQFYECSPEELGFDQFLVAHAQPSPGRHTQNLSLPSTLPSNRPSGNASSATHRLDAARRRVNRTLAASTVSPVQVDRLDARIFGLRSEYACTPPEPMVGLLLDYLEEVNELASERQPAVIQVRLSELTAVLSTLIADSLMKLGNLVRARAWYDTAQNAADDSGNRQLRARVRVQAAMLPFYYGPIEAAVTLAREARMLCRSRPCATGALAAAAEARALARLGDVEGATAAIRNAVVIFEQCEVGPENDAFAFPERRLLLYQSGTYTALGLISQAHKAQAHALQLYPAQAGIDPTLLHLEKAICLARDRDPIEACELAGTTYLRVIPAHRTHIVEERARDVIQALPPAIRRSRAAKELGEILTLPPAGSGSTPYAQRSQIHNNESTSTNPRRL